MNDRRFHELLNLYVDHEIGPDEASELEAEVLRNPSRRRAYDQYCRMQRACSLLGEHERSCAPAAHRFARSLRDAERKIASPRRSVWFRPAYAGGLATAAMAACVVTVFVLNRPAAVTPATPIVADNTTPVAIPVIESSPPRMIVASTPEQAIPVQHSFEFQPVLAAAGMGVVRNEREAEIAANDREALEWMQRVELLPIHRVVVDDQTFESRATLQQDNRVFRSRHGMQGNNAEFTAFQFQR